MSTSNVQNSTETFDKALSFIRNVSAKVENSTTKVIALVEELPERLKKAKNEVVDYATTTPESLICVQEKLNKYVDEMNKMMKRK